MNEENALQTYVSNTGAIENYGKGWQVIWPNFLMLLLVVFVCGLIEAPLNGNAGDDQGSAGVGLLCLLYGIFLAWPIGMSASWVFLKAVRKEEFQFVDMFAVFTRNYWNAVGAGVLYWLIVAAGLLLFILPGIFFACRLAFLDFLIIDRKMGAVEAIKESWRMTRGHGLTVFAMGLLAIPIVIAGLLALIVGVFISSMWIGAAFAVLYHSVCVRRGQAGGGMPVIGMGR